MKKWLSENGLFLVNAALFLIFVAGMAVTGWQVSNSELTDHGAAAQSFGAFLASGDFYEAVFENWESEFLQMGAYVVLTIFLFQKGSAESKPIGEPAAQDIDPRTEAGHPNVPWPVRRGGVALVIYENSLALLFSLLFAGSFIAHAVSGAARYSEKQQLHAMPGVTPWEYLGTSQFWFESFQNWQSEFMVVAVLVIAAVWLRQRGSSESKPVSTPHAETSA